MWHGDAGVIISKPGIPRNPHVQISPEGQTILRQYWEKKRKTKLDKTTKKSKRWWRKNSSQTPPGYKWPVGVDISLLMAVDMFPAHLELLRLVGNMSLAQISVSNPFMWFSFIKTLFKNALQCCIAFCQTSTWMGHRHTYVAVLLNLPPTSHPIPPL